VETAQCVDHIVQNMVGEEVIRIVKTYNQYTPPVNEASCDLVHYPSEGIALRAGKVAEELLVDAGIDRELCLVCPAVHVYRNEPFCCLLDLGKYPPHARRLTGPGESI